MGEALSEGGVFTHHAKARALLEVVRLALEGDLGFGSELAGASCATTADDSDLRPATNCPTRHKAKAGKEYAPTAPQQQQHLQAPHRPASTGSSSRLVPGGPCMWCGVTATPQWRKPRGTNKLLCNACGIYFTRYGRLPEKSHHAYGAAAAAAPAAHLLTAPPSPAVAATPPQDGRPDPPDATDQGAPGGLQAPPPHPHPEMQPQQPLHQQPRPSASTSSLAGSSPLKRKHAPQPDAELLRCLEDTSGSGCGDTAASAAPAPPPASASASARGCLPQQHQPPQQLLLPPPGYPTQQQEQQQQALGLALQLRLQYPGAIDTDARRAATGAAAVGRPESALLRVAPLDLGLQHLTHMQQLGLLGPALAGLGGLPMQSLHLQGPAAVAAACNAAAAHALGYPDLAQHAAMSALRPELLVGRPFSRPVGLLQQPGGVAAAAAAAAAATQLAPWSAYARPAKRQERLPAGESDDSNVSTDSHAATHGDAGPWQDEDKGGMARAATTGGPAGRNATGATASGTSAAGRPPAGMSCSPPEVPGTHFPSASLARPPAAAVPLLACAASGGGSAGPLLPPPLASAGGGATAGGGPTAPDAPEGGTRWS